jgi:signal transduction histidine kinase
VPILIEGEVRYVLNAIFYPAPLTELLVEQKLPASWIATILDRNYIVVARTRDSEKFFGKSATPSLVDQVQKKQEAADRGVSLDGEPVVTAHHRSNFSGWSVALAIPAAELDAPLKSSLLLTGAGGFALLLGALAFAGILGRRIAAPVEALSEAADKLGRGEIPVATPSSIPEIDHVAHAIEDAGSKRKEHEARIEHLNRVYAVLSDINQAIVRIRDPQILLSEACRIAVEKGEFRMAWIGRINRSTGAIEPSASAGVNDGYVENLILGLGNPLHDRGPTVDAVRSGVHVVCNDIENDPRMAPWRDEALKRGYRSSAAFPLKIGDEVVGAFNLYSSEQGFFDAQELALLDELASDIGLALEIHRQESERVRAENALREARDQLEHRVAERTRELEEANAKLHELDRITSQFLANMSHELRTPMNAIIGFAQLLHDGKAGGPVSPDQKEFLGDILNSAGHLLQLINDILDLSKVEAGRMEVLNSTFRLEDVVVEVVQYIAPIMSVKGIRLVRELPPDLPPLTTDRRKLLQILLNLLSNAVKFTEQGEIRIGCEPHREKSG